MLTSDQIERFYKEVESLELRFPVAVISQKTGEPKSNVSKYLNKKLQPSESFINRFNDAFKDEINKSYKIVSHETVSAFSEKETPTYTQKRFALKNGEKNKGIPVYFGNTRAGNIEVYSDDPDMQTPVGFFDSKLFPGCNHAEKVSGDSMHPLIRNQAIIAGKVIDKRGIIFGEKYGIHTKYGMPTAKFIQESEKGPEYLKLISYNETVKPFDIKFDDVTFIFWIKYIINPA